MTTACSLYFRFFEFAGPDADELMLSVLFTFGFLVGAATYVSVLFALHWIASCQFLLTIRLALVYGLLFSCLKILGSGSDDIQGVHVLMLVPFCLGGFINRYHGWQATAWGCEYREPRKLGIADMMDVTAAIALTLAMTQTSELKTFRAAGLVCIVPACGVAAACGLHVWGRLAVLCNDDSRRQGACNLWIAGNAVVSILIGLMTLLQIEQSPANLLALLLIPFLYVTLRFSTAVALSWLRACGWQMNAPHDQSVQRHSGSAVDR